MHRKVPAWFGPGVAGKGLCPHSTSPAAYRCSTTRRSWCRRGSACPANKGARTAGVDKATAAMIETWVGVEAFLGQIRDSLKSGGFRPVEVRQVMIPKGTGKFRKLGIPTIADRVVQASLKAVLEPIFEADFKPCSYGFRPNRRAQDAIAEIHHYASEPGNYQLGTGG